MAQPSLLSAFSPQNPERIYVPRCLLQHSSIAEKKTIQNLIMDQKLVIYSIHITEYCINKLQINMFNFLPFCKIRQTQPTTLSVYTYCNQMKTASVLRKSPLTKHPCGRRRLGVPWWVPRWTSAGTKGSHSSVIGLMKTCHIFLKVVQEP